MSARCALIGLFCERFTMCRRSSHGDSLTPVTPELGGKDAFVVLKDNDVSKVRTCMALLIMMCSRPYNPSK